MSEDLAAVAAQVKALLVVAQSVAMERRNELDAARSRVDVARDASTRADAEVRRLASALKALDGSTGMVGRPRGGDPAKTRQRVWAILPKRDVWTNSEVRDALIEEGHVVPANSVSAALAALAVSGAAIRVGRGRWRSNPDAISDASASTISGLDDAP